jgi:hypothetical protein
VKDSAHHRLEDPNPIGIHLDLDRNGVDAHQPVGR